MKDLVGLTHIEETYDFGRGIEHASHVAKLAGKLFVLFKDLLKLREEDKLLLEVTGLLQDIGVSTGSDENHNEMSYRLLKKTT